MSNHSKAKHAFLDDDATDLMPLEFAVSGDWTPGLTLAFAEMMETALDAGFPIVIPVRKDVTPEQIRDVFEDARALVERAGLTAE
jgi:hypothetical protein